MEHEADSRVRGDCYPLVDLDTGDVCRLGCSWLVRRRVDVVRWRRWGVLFGGGNHPARLVLVGYPWSRRKEEMKTTVIVITKAEYGWIAEVLIDGVTVRRYECATLEEARRIE